jgi:hypothetical protein
VPKSRVRKKKTDTYVRSSEAVAPKRKQPSPVWYSALVIGTMVVGMIWLVTYYVSSGNLPVKSIEAWNVVVGFLWIATGFGLATQWR